MSPNEPNDFGVVDPDGDRFEFEYGKGPGAVCVLEVILQTEKGPIRREIAEISAALWRKVSKRAVRELLRGLGRTERDRRVPTLKIGMNRLSPMVGRELAVLLWSLMEWGAEEKAEAVLSGWRELAREERWWLFLKANTPGQRTGLGWRRALFHAFSEPGDTRSAPAGSCRKKKTQKSPESPGEAGGSGREQLKIFLKNAVYRRLKPEVVPEMGDAAKKPAEESPEDSPEELAKPKQLELF